MRSRRTPTRALRRSFGLDGSLLGQKRKAAQRRNARKAIHRALLRLEGLEPRHLLAALVGVDFDVSSTNRPNEWTSIGANTTPFVQNNLVDEDGNATPFDLEIDLAGGSIGATAANVDASTIPTHSQSLAGIDGQIFTTNTGEQTPNPVTFEWSDLTPGTAYEVYVFGLEGFFQSIQQTVTITGAGTPVVFVQDFNTNRLQVNRSEGSSTTPLSAYAEQIVADGSGNINIRIDPVNLPDQTFDVSIGGLAIREVEPPALTVSIVDDSVSEGAGAGATTGLVVRNTDTTSDLTVTLASSDISEATVSNVPPVVIPAGQTSVAFQIDAVDDALLDGTQTVTITATAAGHADGSDTIDVTDDDADVLTVTIDAVAVLESAGAAATTGAVTRSNVSASSLTVNLVSNDPRISVPASVVISGGSASATFDVDVNDNSTDEATGPVSITASASGFDNGAGVVTVIDDDVVADLGTTIAAASIAEPSGPAATTATITRNTGVIFNHIDSQLRLTDGTFPDAVFTSDQPGNFSQSIRRENPSDPLDVNEGELLVNNDAGGANASGFVSIETEGPGLGEVSDSTSTKFTFDIESDHTFTLNGSVFADSDNALAEATVVLSGPGLSSPLTFTRVADAVTVGGLTNFSETGTLTPGTYTIEAFGVTTADDVDNVFGEADFDFDLQLVAAETQVSLAGDPSEIDHADVVTFPAGQSSMTVVIGAVDDVNVDGDQNPVLTASAAGHVSGSDSVEVTDDDVNIGTGDVLQVFRIAVAATGEFTAAFGGSIANAFQAINDAIDAVNSIFISELAIRLQLVSGQNVVYANAATDPYSGADLGALIGQNQTNLDLVVGSGNYDIGHVVSVAAPGAGGGGLATLGVVGLAGFKARGATIAIDPLSTSFITTISHEIGHQFGADHTFNGSLGQCDPSQYSPHTAYEPGSGSTLMSYAGICPVGGGGDNLQSDPDQMFHSASFHQIQRYISDNAHANPSSTPDNDNNIPTIDAGIDQVIPARTAFSLIATSSDPDGSDILTHSWEQLDLGPQMNLPLSDNGFSPLFRAFEPTVDPMRTFPNMPDLLANVDTAPLGEALPTTNRELNFRATVRDGNGGVNSDDMLVTVIDTGEAFAVTSPNAASDSWTGGANETITWNVAGTDGNGIDAAEVDIFLSTDGGQTFPISLGTTANDGSHTITVPNIDASEARVLIRGSGRVFFDVSNENFTIVANSNAPGVTITESGGDTAVIEGTGTDSYDISLNTDPSGDVTIDIAADGQTEISLDGSSYGQTQTVVLNSTAARTVFVRAIDDSLEEGSHISTLTHAITASTSATYPVGTLISNVVANVTDDELPPVVGLDFDFNNEPSPLNWARQPAFNSGNPVDMLRDDGVQTSIDLTFEAINGGSIGIATPLLGSDSNVPRHSPILNEIDGGMTFTGGLRATWSDLTPGANYGIYVFGLEDDSQTNYVQTITITGETTLPPITQTLNDGELQINDAVGTDTRTLLSYEQVVAANNFGEIRVQILSASSGIALAGLAIREIPAPGLPTVVLSVNNPSMPETGGTSTVTATLSDISSEDVVVDLGFSGSASLTDDYTRTGTTITIAAGSLTGTVDLASVTDDLDEIDETIDVEITGVTGAIEDGIQAQTVTILDDDPTPSLSIDDVTVDESAGNATFTVTLSAASAQDVTVTVNTADGTATVGEDYTGISNNVVTILAGNTTATVQVPILGDVLDEDNETFFVNLSNPTAATIGDGQGLGTINDDDATPALSINDVSSDEDAGTVNFTVTLSAPSGRSVDVTAATANGTASAGTDYNALASTVFTIPAGNTTVTVPVSILEDALDEPNETYVVNLTNPVNATIADNQGSGTIVDNDPTPTVSIDDVTVGEAAGTATFTVSLSAASGQDVDVTVASSDDTATAGSDYTAFASTVVTIPAGDTTATVNVGILNDDLDEADETFFMNLSSPVGATIGDGQGIGTITDDEGAVSITINDVTVNEADANATFTISLSAASGQDVTVSWATADGTATAGADYTAVPVTPVVITAGNTTATVTVPLQEDLLDELDETFVVNLTSPINANIGDAQGVATIQDNDATPTLSVNDVSVAEDDGTATFTISLSAASGRNVSVSVATANGTATAGDDYTAVTPTVVNIPAGQTSVTLPVTILQDALDEPDETYLVNLSSPTAATIADGEGLGTIVDEDPTPSLSINDVTVDEGAGTATFTVSLSAASGNDVTVVVGTDDGTATAGADYTAVSGTQITIPAGETSEDVVVTILEDNLDELDESFVVNLTNASNASIADDQGTGTIVDNDASPSLSVNDVTVGESAGNASFTISLSEVSGRDVSVTVGTANGTATAGEDYTAVSPTVVNIAAGQTSVTLPVAILGDVLDELDETFTVNLSGPIGATIADGVGLGTITDDDATPTLSVNDVTVDEGAGTATFSISLSALSGQNVTVSVATSDVTATAGSDYTAVTPTVVTIPAGNLSVTLPVGVINDVIDENDETFTVNLTSPTAATIADGEGVGTITDNDAAPTLSVNDVSVGEGDGTATFTIGLSAASGMDVQVTVATADDTATAGQDYTAVNATTVTIAAGQTNVTLPVSILEDNIDEGNETFFANLSGPLNATIADGQGVGTIEDNDAAGFTVTETDGYTLVFENGTTDTVHVVLDAPPVSQVVIDVSSADVGEATVSPSSLTFDSTNWNVPQEVTVTGVDDPDVDGDQVTPVTFSVNDAASDNAFDALPDQIVDVTTRDVDGSIRGTVWEDINGNQTRDGNEPPLGSVQVYLDLNRDGALNAGEPVQFTAADGTYSFENVAPGEYVVAQVIPNGLAQTFPQVLGTAGTFAQLVGDDNNQAILPTYATHAPNDVSRLFVLEKGFTDPGSGFSIPGRIRILDLQTGTMSPTPFLTIADTDFESEGGLVGMAFHPDFSNNGKFYVYVSIDNGGLPAQVRPGETVESPFSSHVLEYTVSQDDPNVADPASRREIISYVQPTTIHNGGWIGFGPDGFLYIMSGDGGDQHDSNNNAQTLTTMLGKVLRIDVNGDDFPTEDNRNYAIPTNNPFVGDPDALDEIWAYGLRNPWRASFDPLTGDLIIGDVGQQTREEINWQPANSQGGENYGWRLREGLIATPTGGVGGPRPDGNVDPILDYEHGSGPMQGNSVVGGHVYRGPIEALHGLYIFADTASHNIWAYNPDDGTITRLNDVLQTDAGVIGDGLAGFDIISIATDESGNLYFVQFDGEIHRLAMNLPGTHTVIVNGGQIIEDIDFGNQDPQASSISDRVWHDIDADGVQDSNEPGIDGITVNLLGVAGNQIGTTTTANGGLYRFDELGAGDYQVQFVLPDNFDGFSPQDVGQDDAVDSDADANGLTGVITLAPSVSINTVDAGMYRLASIGDLVWNDANGDGIQGPNEVGINGIPVHLVGQVDQFTESGDRLGWIKHPTNPNIQPNQVSSGGNGGGYLRFESFGGSGAESRLVIRNLSQWRGDYTGKIAIEADIRNFGNTDLLFRIAIDGPGGWWSSTNATAQPLAAGSDWTRVRFSLDPADLTNNFADGGSDLAATLASVNELRILNSADPNFRADVIVANVGIDNIASVLASTNTSGGGEYEFEVVPGTYRVRVETPDGRVMSPQDQGENDDLDSDTDPVTGLTGPITVASDGADNTNDAGLILPSLIVTIDADSISENGGTTTGTVSRNMANGAVVVTLRSTDETEAVVETPITIAAGETTSAPFTITGVNDFIIDGTIGVGIHATADGYADGRDFLNVTDDDEAGFLITESDGTTVVTEAAGEQHTDTFDVVLTAQPQSIVVLTVVSGDLTEAGVEPSTLTFTPNTWNIPQTVTVEGIDENTVDGDQVSVITVSVDDAASDDDFDGLGDQTVQVTTIDDDEPGFRITETASGGSTRVSETGTTDEFDVVLTAQPETQVVLTVTSADTGEVVVDRATLTFTRDNWDQPQRVNVTGVDDDIADGDQTVLITVAVDPDASDNAFDSLPDQVVEAINEDDDTAALTLRIASDFITEGDGPEATKATVSRNTPADEDLVVTLSTSDDTEATVPAQVTILAGQVVSESFPIAAVDDAIVDGTQKVTITASADNHASSSGDLEVRDNDASSIEITSVETSATIENKGLPNRPVVIEGTFEGGGPNTLVEIQWGDGTTTFGTVDLTTGSFRGEHEYSTGGIFDVIVTVRDDEDFDTAGVKTVVTGVGLREDGTLQIVGTNRNDKIFVFRRGSKIRVRTRLHGQRWVNTDFKANEVKSIFVFACEGHDNVKIQPWVRVPTTILAGGGNDRIMGGDGPTRVEGGPGNDVIRTGRADDVVVDLEGRNHVDTGRGDDEVSTGEGHDVIETDYGNDIIKDLGGINYIYSGNGNDIINTGDGRDIIVAGSGHDIINSGGGTDIIFAGRGNDIVNAGDGHDAVHAGSGHDLVRGGAGNDAINGAAGNDILLGEEGHDLVYGSNGRDLIIGGVGYDWLKGGNHDDIVIAAVTEHDASDESLQAIMSEWTARRSYSTRVNNIRSGGGNTGGVALNSATVEDDGNKDKLLGQRGRDWFFARLASDNASGSSIDWIGDRRSNEEVDQI